MRTKYLCSLVVVTATLSCATLLVVRRTAKAHLNGAIEEDARNAIATFQVIQRQRQLSLSHKADLLATLAQIRNEDASTIQESSHDPWQSADCNLFALADPHGKIVALQTTTPGFAVQTAEGMLRRSQKGHATSGWWYSGTDLYQVALQRIYEEGTSGKTLAGIVIVGREIDIRAAKDLQATSSSEVVFRYGNEIAVSTLSPLQEQEFNRDIQAAATGIPIRMGRELFLAKSVNLTPGEEPGVTLTVLKSYSGASAFLNSLNHLLLGLGLLAVLAGGALAYLISDAFTRPLARLTAGVRALEAGDFTYALEANGGDEVAEVTRAFSRMRDTLQSNEAKRQQLEQQLRQSQRMEAMGRLAGGVAHDFNNLLTVIKGHCSLLLERLQPNDHLIENSKQITKAADRAASLTRQLLAFSRMQVLQPKVLDLNVVVADMKKMMGRLVREDIEFSLVAGESLGRVKADPMQIEQVLLNLVVNACDAMPKGGKLTIETRNISVDEQFVQTRVPMPPGQYVLLSVADTGHGMDANTKARIFEPFFTTKELGKGTGLGLATVYGIVKQSQGFIWVDTEPGKGTTFEVFLPQVLEEVAETEPEDVTSPSARRPKTVLLVEDEEALRELGRQFLTSAGYRVLTAEDGKKALAIASKADERIHVLVTDVVMPNVRGPELSVRLRRERPNIKVIYVSGYLDYDKGSGEFLEDALFLQKPFSREVLISTVGEALKSERKSGARKDRGKTDQQQENAIAAATPLEDEQTVAHEAR